MNPIEMGMPNEAAVLEQLKKAGYEDLFKKVFPDAAQPLTYDNYAEAVAAFERTLITRDRFDDFLGGKENALTEPEKKGLAAFMKVGCADCHQAHCWAATATKKWAMPRPMRTQRTWDASR